MRLRYYMRSCLVVVFATMAQMGFFSSCQDYDPHIPLKSYDEMLKSDEIWNFSMTRDINIDLDLGLRGVTYPVSVYAEYPYDEDGELLDGIEPIFAFFTSDGRYKADVELPSVYNKLYFACGGIGVPSLIVGNVVNGHVEFGEALTRANVDLYEYSITDNGTTLTPAQYSIKKWGVESTDPLYFSRFGIDNNNSNPNFVNTLYTLYPWAVNGAPLATTDDAPTTTGPVTTHTPDPSDQNYNYEFYYDEDKNAVNTASHFTVTQTEGPKYDTETKYRPTTEIDNAYILFAKNGNRLTVTTGEKTGTLSITRQQDTNYTSNKDVKMCYEYINDNSETKTPTVTFRNSEAPGKETIEIPLAANTAYTLYLSSDHTAQLTNFTYVETAGDTYVLSVNTSTGAITYTKNSATVTLAETVFSNVPEVTIDYKQEPYNVKKTDCSYKPNSTTLYYYIPMTDANAASIQFSVPSYTKAKLTVVFADNQAAKFKLQKHNGTKYSDYYKQESNDIKGKLVDHIIEGGDYQIVRSSNNQIYYISVVYDSDDNETGTTHTRTSVVYKYDKNTNDKLTKFYQNLTNTLWHGLGSKSKAKEAEGEFFNTGYTSADQSKNNITVTKDCEVFVTFLGEFNAYSSNCVGYYYYHKNNVPTSPDGLNKFLIFPNCSSNLYSNADKYKGYKEITPLRTGDQVQLLYYKGDGHNESGCPAGYSKTFPEGTVIGWFLIYSGFNGWDTTNKSGADNMLDGKINLNVYNNNIQERRSKNDEYKKYLSQVYYSDPIFNTTPIARVIQFTDTESGEIALCFEDSFDETVGYDDLTYDDLLLSIHSSPSGSLHNNSDQETITETIGDVSYQELGTYLFEDILDGKATDFDMNDVVVEYNRKYTLSYDATVNTTAHLTKVKETYKVINDGATYLDAFVVKTPFATSNIAKVVVKAYKEDGKTEFYNQEWTSFSQGEHTFATSASSYQQPGYEVGNDGILSYVLFDDINKIAMNVVYTFEIQFKTGGITGGLVAEDTENHKYNLSNRTYSRSNYDPFVVVRDHPASNGKRCEVHTPGKNFTEYGDDIFANGAKSMKMLNYWNVAKFGDGTYLPFALDITATGFKVCSNTIPINSVYSKFNTWAASNHDGGSASADWYMTPGNGVAASYPTDR